VHLGSRLWKAEPGWLLAGCVCVASLAWSDSVRAQATTDLRVRLESAPGAWIGGALVALLDPRDSVIAEGLTNEEGVRTLRAAPGTYRIRARRIGFLPYISPPFTLPRNNELVLHVETQRVVLQSIVVASQSKCARNDRNAEALSAVWDEIDKALRASQITTEDLAGIGRAEIYHRRVSLTGTVLSADTSHFTIGGRRPFVAVSANDLATAGYVKGDAERGWIYYAPDETVLLSEPFSATHCFRLIRDEPRGLIGVAFEPVPAHRLADITGVLWVDEGTSELREIAFTFVNAGVFSQYDAGGFTHFARLRSGAWIVDNWRLRAPLLEIREDPYEGRHLVKMGYSEDGGRILSDGRSG
jgi:hypothetical protein